LALLASQLVSILSSQEQFLAHQLFLTHPLVSFPDDPDLCALLDAAHPSYLMFYSNLLEHLF